MNDIIKVKFVILALVSCVTVAFGLWALLASLDGVKVRTRIIVLFLIKYRQLLSLFSYTWRYLRWLMECSI